MFAHQTRLIRKSIKEDTEWIERMDLVDGFVVDNVRIVMGIKEGCPLMVLTNADETRCAMLKPSRALLKRWKHEYDAAEKIMKASKSV